MDLGIAYMTCAECGAKLVPPPSINPSGQPDFTESPSPAEEWNELVSKPIPTGWQVEDLVNAAMEAKIEELSTAYRDYGPVFSRVKDAQGRTVSFTVRGRRLTANVQGSEAEGLVLNCPRCGYNLIRWSRSE